jgi:L-threonylcarbamoyladenylate synthase
LARRFWPGPLTLVVKRKANVPDIVTTGLETIALRVPRHLVALQLLKEFGGGIVGPSANLSGHPSPTSADHVYDDLKGKIDLILDAGPTTIGVESTVLDVTVNPPVILRLGGLSQEEIQKEIGEVRGTGSKELLKRSPGTFHRHYAPRARVVIFPPENQRELEKQLNQAKVNGKLIGTISHSKSLNIDAGEFHIVLPSSLDLYARNIFRALRELDKKGIDIILVEGVEEKGLGAAIMDRLRKAAAKTE